MLPDIIGFRKPIEQRRKEYNHMLGNQGTCSSINKVWAYELEEAIGNLAKWQALWQMGEDSCQEFNTMYPTAVIVRVQEVLFDDLSAVVLVEYTQEDISLPDMMHVPLFELYPTKVQDVVSTVVAKNIADWLDRCRYFLVYLWYPWDSSENCTIGDWAEEHLENRLQLQYDIRNGIVDKSTAQYVEQLLKSSLQVVDAIEEGEDRMPTASDEYKLNTIRNLLLKENMKLEINLLEVPELRAPMTEYIRNSSHVYSNLMETVLVTVPCTLATLAATLDHVQSLVTPDVSISLSTNPKQTLNSVPSGSFVILGGGVHSIEDLGALMYGGRIAGTGSHDTIITTSEQSPPRYMFLTSGGSLICQNLIIKRGRGVLFWVREGVVRLEGCQLVSDESDSRSSKGVVVQPGARLELVNCVVKNLETAIVAKKGSTIYIESSTIADCSQGIKILHSASVSLANAAIEQSSRAGIVWYTTQHDVKSGSGSIDIVGNVPGLAIESNCRFFGNSKDAQIYCLPREDIVE